ncbi:MAG: hypothetical protein O7G87_10315 [bacterium]|nr:hypothetical protein [bacterium]
MRPFSPADANLFTTGAYPAATALVPASGSELSESDARTELEAFLNTRFSGNGEKESKVQNALRVFSDSATVAKISNPTLRAGLVSLTGTLAEPAIRAVVNRSETVDFGTVVSGDYAELREQVLGGRQGVFDERYRSEAFALFGPVFARLALQEDFSTGQEEELIGAAVLSLVAMQQVLVDSGLALSGSELSRRLNTQMLARLNSGRAAFPRVGIYPVPDGEIFPGGTKFDSFAAVFAPLPSQETQAGSVLKAYLERLVPEGVRLPESPGFDSETLDLLDRYQNVLTAEEMVRVARILKLRFRD